MKKSLLSAFVILALSCAAGAQNIYDAINLSENHYYGTARSMALGNAVTALGGDLGSVGINPAGSAVALYSQFVITPGISISSTGMSYSPSGDSAFGASQGQSKTRFGLPNIGVSINIDTDYSSWLKSMSFGLTVNQTNSYLGAAGASGINPLTSRFGEMAASASVLGYKPSLAGSYNTYYSNDTDIYGNYYAWDILTAYQGCGISDYDSGGDTFYVGNTESIAEDAEGFLYTYVPGDLAQTFSTVTRGYKSDICLNWAFNVSDRFYFGFNLGLPTMDYRRDETFTEAAVNPEKFPVTFVIDGGEVDTNFKSATYSYAYAAKVRGLYAKFGFIYLPTRNLRIGAAIQTPTGYKVTETWEYGVATRFGLSSQDGSAYSPVGQSTYTLRSPYEVNVGLALTIGAAALLSADYEMMDYSIMRYRDTGGSTSGAYTAVNEINSKFGGVSHSLRVGAEVRLTPAFSLRAGYNFRTSPERHYTDSNCGGVFADVTADNYADHFDEFHTGVWTLGERKYYSEDIIHSFSFGAGYSSAGSFFADICVRLNKYPRSVSSLYYKYDNYDSDGSLLSSAAPCVRSSRDLWDVALTLGWRF